MINPQGLLPTQPPTAAPGTGLDPRHGEASEQRYALLTWLVWELHRLARTTLLAVRANGEPVLYLLRADGRTVAVLAIQRGNQWLFMWGPDIGIQAERTSTIAKTIAEAVN